MNYAEDRLDRRARSTITAPPPGGAATTSTQDQLGDDLTRAHAAFRAHFEDEPLARSNDARQSLHELRSAHELAGKTLRDGGRNNQAVYHFGMAWRVCHALANLQEESSDCSGATKNADEEVDEWRAVGDYAQMCEFSGFPEVGVLAILFHRAGGRLDASKGGATDANESEDTGKGCGCGMPHCGISRCFIAFPATQSPIMEEMLEGLNVLSVNSVGENFPSHSDILGQLELMARTRKSSTLDDPVETMHSFLAERGVMDHVPSILKFWEESNHEHRSLPPVVTTLLLKLLYSSPIGNPFLQLACISMPYLAAKYTPKSPEGKMLVKKYKSHNAYFVFIRALVLGERVKKHKRKGTCHTPVWNVVFGLEWNDNVVVPKTSDGDDSKKTGNRSISNYLRGLLETCSQSAFTPTCRGLNCLEQHIVAPATTHRPIFIVGDSHVLSMAWQTICIDTSKCTTNDDNNNFPMYRTAVPFPATGIKAWHARPSTQFFTHANLHACLQRLPSSVGHTIIISAGEIDCREGIGGTLLQGYYHNCSDAVERTVLEYLASLTELAEQYQLQLLVMPVAPHAYRSEKNGKSTGRARRRETMHLWNVILRRELGDRKQQTQSKSKHVRCKYHRVFLLDYEEKLRHPDANSVGYVLDPAYNADYTHVNSAVVPLVEDASLHCGCDLALLVTRNRNEKHEREDENPDEILSDLTSSNKEEQIEERSADEDTPSLVSPCFTRMPQIMEKYKSYFCDVQQSELYRPAGMVIPKLPMYHPYHPFRNVTGDDILQVPMARILPRTEDVMQGMPQALLACITEHEINVSVTPYFIAQTLPYDPETEVICRYQYALFPAATSEMKGHQSIWAQSIIHEHNKELRHIPAANIKIYESEHKTVSPTPTILCGNSMALDTVENLRGKSICSLVLCSRSGALGEGGYFKEVTAAYIGCTYFIPDNEMYNTFIQVTENQNTGEVLPNIPTFIEMMAA